MRFFYLPLNNLTFHSGSFFWDPISHFPCCVFHLHVLDSLHCCIYEKFSFGETFQYWQASKDRHVWGTVGTVSESPFQAGSNKLITLRSKWLASCSPSLKYLCFEGWEKPKTDTLNFYLLNPDMKKYGKEKKKKGKEIRKCCVFTFGNYPKWQEGPPSPLSEILKSFVRLSRNQLIPKSCLGFHIWQRLRFIKISEVTREPPEYWPHLGPILSSCWAQADSQQGSQLA